MQHEYLNKTGDLRLGKWAQFAHNLSERAGVDTATTYGFVMFHWMISMWSSGTRK